MGPRAPSHGVPTPWGLLPEWQLTSPPAAAGRGEWVPGVDATVRELSWEMQVSTRVLTPHPPGKSPVLRVPSREAETSLPLRGQRPETAEGPGTFSHEPVSLLGLLQGHGAQDTQSGHG